MGKVGRSGPKSDKKIWFCFGVGLFLLDEPEKQALHRDGARALLVVARRRKRFAQPGLADRPIYSN